jgi:hypothetical protein
VTALSLQSTTVNGPGTLTNATGRTLVVQSSTIAAPLVNEGLLRLRASNTISGGLTTTATSTIRVEGDGNCCSASTTVSSGFTNNGLIELTDVNNPTSSQLTVSAGTLTNAPGGTIVSVAALGGTRNLTATLDNQGTLTVMPGAAGVLSLTGSLTNSGTIGLELGGTLASQYDRLQISGAATFGGTLNVTTFGGFNPAVGNAFTLLTYGSQTGLFATTNFPVLALGSWLTATNATSYTTTVVP